MTIKTITISIDRSSIKLSCQFNMGLWKCNSLPFNCCSPLHCMSWKKKIKDKLISQTRVKIALINTLQGGDVRTLWVPEHGAVQCLLSELSKHNYKKFFCSVFCPIRSICDMNEGLINNDRLDLLLLLPLLLALVWSASAEEERRRRQRRWAVIIETKHVRHAAI